MKSLFAIRGSAWLLTVLLVTVPASVHADELDFLPSDCNIVVHCDVSKIRKSSTYKEIVKILPKFDEELGDWLATVGLRLGNIARLTAGLVGIDSDDTSNSCLVVTTLKPVSVDDIKAALKKKVRDEAKIECSFAEKKCAGRTIHVFELLGVEAISFLVDGNYVVVSESSEVLKKVLEAKKRAAFSPALNAVVRTFPANEAAIVINLTKLPGKKKDKDEFKALWVKLLRSLAPSLPAAFDSTTIVVVRLKETERLQLAATVAYKDGASAAKGITALRESIKLIKAQLVGKENSLPKDIKKSIEGFLNAIKLTTKKSELIAEATLDPVAVAMVIAWSNQERKPASGVQSKGDSE